MVDGLIGSVLNFKGRVHKFDSHQTVVEKKKMRIIF